MNLRKGFTLIELIAVIIVLAILALITYPIIDDVLTNARNSAYERQKDSILDAAKLYVTTNGNYSTVKEKISFQTLIDAGVLNDGNILDPRDSSKEMPGCVIYNWDESKKQYIFEYSEECTLPSYALGDLLKVQVSDTETQNIYVLEVNGDEIVGLLDRNLPGGTVAWISEEDYNSAGGNSASDDASTSNQNLYEFGAVTANKALEDRTSTWNRVSEKYLPSAEDVLKLTDYYKDLESSGETANWESKYFEKLEASYEVECSSGAECREKLTEAGYGDILLPEWASINLYTTGDNSAGYGYWTSTPMNYSVVSFPDGAWGVDGYGTLNGGADVGDSGFAGVRPVIHISQSNVISKLEEPEYVESDNIPQ